MEEDERGDKKRRQEEETRRGDKKRRLYLSSWRS